MSHYYVCQDVSEVDGASLQRFCGVLLNPSGRRQALGPSDIAAETEVFPSFRRSSVQSSCLDASWFRQRPLLSCVNKNGSSVVKNLT